MPAAPTYTSQDVESLLVSLQNTLGIVVPEEQRNTMVQRLLPVLSELNEDSLDALARALSNGSGATLAPKIMAALSHYTTGWHLNSELRTLFREYVFNQLGKGSRLWVVGCGRGELGWSVGMELDDHEHQSDEKTGISIVASDTLAEDISKANSATYDELELAGLGDGFKQVYFTPAESGEGYTVKDRVRERIEFRQCDLVHGGCQDLGQFEAIMAPEVLSYFTNGVRAMVLDQFISMLKPGGMLIVGQQCMIPAQGLVERVEHPSGIFYRKR